MTNKKLPPHLKRLVRNIKSGKDAITGKPLTKSFKIKINIQKKKPLIKRKVIAIALDRKTQGTLGFNKKSLISAKKEIFKGRKRFVGFTDAK